MEFLQSYAKRVIILSIVVLGFVLTVGNSRSSSASTLPAAESATASASEPVKRIDRRLLGQSFDMWRTDVFDHGARTFQTIEVATATRGPSNGLIADFYNWKDPLGLHDSRRRQRPTNNTEAETNSSAALCANRREWDHQIGTLDYLRLGRDKNMALNAVVNTRGYPNWFFWPAPTANPYVTTDLDELKQLAADWILYTHYTVKNFDQSHVPSANAASPLEQRSAAILSELRWENCDGTSPRPVLPLPGESLPEITYWEIGNEPVVPIAGVRWVPSEFPRRYGVLNTSDPQYVGITNSMVEMDRLIHGSKTIKIGPTIAISAFTEAILKELKNAGAQVDFVSYHPYDTIFGHWDDVTYTPLPNIADKWNKNNFRFLRDRMSGIYTSQAVKAAMIRNVYPDAELLATEWNPSSWEVNWTLPWRERSMAQALAVMETIFSFSRVGISQAHYYTLPVSKDAPTHITNPTYRTFKFLKNQLFEDTSDSYLLASYDNGAPSATYYRGYAAQNGASGRVSFWGLNWGGTSNTVNFSVDVDRLYSYSMTECYSLSAPTILYGAVNDPAAPPLEQELPIIQTPMSLVWNDTPISYSMTIPPSSWVACFITRTPKSPLYTTHLPVITK